MHFQTYGVDKRVCNSEVLHLACEILRLSMFFFLQSMLFAHSGKNLENLKDASCGSFLLTIEIF